MSDPVDTPCVGGPKNGRTITHRPDDTRDRKMKGGYYRYQPESQEPGKSHGDGWVWHQFIPRSDK